MTKTDFIATKEPKEIETFSLTPSKSFLKVGVPCPKTYPQEMPFQDGPFLKPQGALRIMISESRVEGKDQSWSWTEAFQGQVVELAGGYWCPLVVELAGGYWCPLLCSSWSLLCLSYWHFFPQCHGWIGVNAVASIG